MTDKTILQDARDLLAGGHSQWDPMDPEAVADIGVRLARVVSEHQKLLDKLKPILRTCADAIRPEGEKHVNWTTDNGSCSVTFPEARYSARKDVDWDALRRDLGSSFDDYFDTKVVHSIKKDLPEIIRGRMKRFASEDGDGGGSGSELGTVMSAIERTSPTPRVGFRPKS
jgi:hypothetical protein